MDLASLDLRTLLSDGDYATALRLYETEGGEAVSPALRIALARAYDAERRHAEALALLEPISDQIEIPQERAQALALMAAIYEQRGAWEAAIEALSQYLELERAAAPYVEWRIAEALQALGRDDEAAVQLGAIELDGLPVAFQAEVLEELAAVLKRMGRFEQALEIYERILGFAHQESYRALVKYRRGEVLLELGRRDAAIAQYTAVLSEHPEQRGAYLALQALDALGVAALDDLARGKLLYRVGEYQASLVALERYVLEYAQESLVEAYHYLALTHGRLGRYAQAFELYDLVIRQYPDDTRIADVWMDKARAAQRYDSDPSGIYYEFRRLYPQHTRAPEALWLGGRALEGEREWERAAEFYALLSANYPSSAWQAEARFREGLMAYADGQSEQALSIWESALEGTLSLHERVRVLSWAGLAARAQGDKALAYTYWDEAATAAPNSYYGLRARDLAVDVIPRLAPDVSSDMGRPQIRSSPWDEIEAWVRTWQEPGDESPLDLSQDPLARRGFALLDLGWRAEGLEALRTLRDRSRDDPVQLLDLMRAFDERDLHALTISVATHVLSLGRRAAASDPPSALMQLAYPTTYGHLIVAEAHRNALDPYLFLALIRQESRFDPEALSYAGARGLTQVMPSTGSWIAERIGTQGYRTELLDRPMIA
ncbi:MAG: tetratricopeptide repeat protein, partial [Anaerolineae bacterium]|nr:tetratricopeptide repeat protein [Anaerolineae bacterium]